MIYGGQILKDVGGIEISRTSENPNFAITLRRSRSLADVARLEAIATAKQELETQRFISAVFAANKYPSMPMVYIF